MKQSEVTLEDLPAPGEPLTPHIHEDNQKLIDEDIAERAKRIRGKLTWLQRLRFNRRYSQLHKKLNHAQYNQLVTEKERLKRLCITLRHEMKSASTRKRKGMKARMVKAAIQGQSIHEQLEALRPLAEEFESITKRLKIHEDVIAWEREDTENRKAFRREARTWEKQIKAVFRQDGRVHHKYDDSKGREVIRIPIIEQVIFKEDRVLYQIRTTFQNPILRFFGRWRSALPYDVDIADLTDEKTLENLSAGCNRVVTVERSKTGTNLFYAISRLDSPDGIPRKVLYSKTLNWYPEADHEKTPWAGGVTENRQVVWFNFEEQPHVLIAGASGGGKSNHVNSMIATFCKMNDPADLRLLLVDLKGGIEFVHWSGIKHSLAPMIKSADKVLDGLRFMRRIMEHRLTRFEHIRAKNLSSYNAKAVRRLPRLIMIIDELATLLGLGKLTADIHTEIMVLSSQGRAVGVHLLLCTQHSSVDVLPGYIKTNMSMRISSRMPSYGGSMVILSSITAATLPSIPGRMVFSKGNEEIIAQSPFISDEEISLAVWESKQFNDPDNSEFETHNDEPELEQQDEKQPDQKFSRDDLIRLSLEKFGGKLSPDRIFGELGNEIATLRELRDMIKVIRGEGKVEHNGVTYAFKPNRNSYVLTPLNSIIEQLNGIEDNEDTAEIHSAERSIEQIRSVEDEEATV